MRLNIFLDKIVTKSNSLYYLELKKSEDKAALCAVVLKSGCALSAPLREARAAALRTTGTINADDKLANQLT